MTRGKTRSLAFAAAALSLYAFAYRPWFLHWGATALERRGPWPGDELAPPGTERTTRAITIAAPANAVWPWIVQIGQDRAGFYSHRVLENIAGADMPDVRRIIPGFQQRAAGDVVRLASAKRFGELGRMIVARLEPERAMILVMPADARAAANGETIAGGTWGFILNERPDGTTRLIMRSVGDSTPSLPMRAVRALTFDWPHYVMERKMMENIKLLAERSRGEQT